MSLTFRQVADAADALEALAELRIEVFREWPYLYEGDRSYEREYLTTYARTEGAFVLLAEEEGALAGACTGVPLAAEGDVMKAAFDLAEVSRTFYGGETVLRKSFRGRGIYRHFIEERERFARERGFEQLVFCGVRRPEDHPKRPPTHRDIELVWQHLGYEPTGQSASIPWKEIGHETEQDHVMDFWRKAL